MMLLVVLLLVAFSMKVDLLAWGSSPFCSSTSCVFILSVFVFLTGCCTNMVAAEVSDICENNTLHVSLDPVFQNETIDLVCQKPGTNASELYFTYSGQYDPRDYTAIINDTAIRLMLPPEADRDKSDNFKCMQGDTCVGNRNVFYEYYPVGAQDVQCWVYHWDRMLCRWSLGKQYNYKQDVTCDFSLHFLSKELAASSWAKCPDLTNTSCHWDADHFTSPIDRLNISIKISNSRRPEAFVYTNISFTVNDIVQLDPIKNTSIAVIKTGDPRCRTLSWPVTGRAKYKTLTFNVTYKCSCSESKTQITMYSADSNGTASTMLCNLHPYCAYTASISGRYIKSQDTPTGFWSDVTIFSFITDNQVPSHSPLTTAGLYEHTLETENNIKLYWKPLNDCELNSESSTVTYQSSMSNVVIDHPVFYMKFKVDEDPVTVTLQARNDVGYAMNKQTIQVFPKHIGHISSDLTVEFSDRNLSPVRLTIDPRDSSATAHTVVWCEGSSFCEKPVLWRILPVFELLTSLNVSKEHRFGLITKYESGANSGIVWENCLYQAGKVPGAPPKDVHRSDQQPEEGFRLEWLPYDCNEGYIHHYNLSYCTSKPATKCNCTSKKTNVEVSKQETSYFKKGLVAGSTVCVWLRGVSSAGSGPSSDPVTFTITATGTSPWVYVGIALAGLFTIIIVLLGCIFIQRFWKRLQRKSDVYVPDIPDPKREPLLGPEANQNVEDTPYKKPYKKPNYRKPNYRADPCTDSGKSSMSNGSSRTDSRSSRTDSRSNWGKGNSSDSAISSDHVEQTTDTAENKSINTTSMGTDSEMVGSYMKANELSGGLSSADSYSVAVGNESGHRDPCVSGDGIARGNGPQGLTVHNRPNNEPSGKYGDDRSINAEDEQDENVAYELNDISAILD